METFNSEKLINEVQKHPCLYAKSSMEYRNKIKRARAWADISVALDISGNQCMTKWRSIRDRYNRELKKSVLKSGSATAIVDSKFQYMEHLSFLKEFVSPRKTTSSVASTQEDFVDEEHVDGFQQALFLNESEVSNIDDFEDDLIIEEQQQRFSFGDETFELPSTSNSSTIEKKSSGRRTKIACVEDSFKSFMTKMMGMHEKRMEMMANKTSSHEGFFKIVSTKLDMLPTMVQEDAKMFYLNYLHDLLKNN